MSEVSSNNKRIEYIDALRGFTMILVVFFHLSQGTFRSELTFINQLFVSFRMPLFFFVSGFIGYRADVAWNMQTWWTMSRKKLLIQLLPTLVIGLICTYAHHNLDLKAFVTDNMKLGYWFTIVLLEMFLLVYTVNVFVYSTNSKLFKKRQQFIITTLAIVLFFVAFICKVLPTLEKVCDIFSLHATFKYFPYFAFGYLCSMDKESFHKLIDSRYFLFAIIVGFSILFYINQFYIYSKIGDSAIYRMLYFIIRTFIGFLGLLIVYSTFRTYKESFTSDKNIGRALQYIGKRTLDIYLLHYFFLPGYMPQLGCMFCTGKHVVLELVIGCVISLIVVGLCLVVSNILRTSPILSKYLFGAKK